MKKEYGAARSFRGNSALAFAAVLSFALAPIAIRAQSPESMPGPAPDPRVPLASLEFENKCESEIVTWKRPSDADPGITYATFDRQRPVMPPEYPPASLRRNEQGTPIISVLVNETGATAGVALEQSSGFVLLDNAALKATRDWRFIPAKKGEQPVCMRIWVPLKFSIPDTPAAESAVSAAPNPPPASANRVAPSGLIPPPVYTPPPSKTVTSVDTKF